ncbi:MAG: hypothetical protein M3501_02440, partial [Actinomycetota bacterium]|nr:hypothetical protein [Actinomycetota bacterium]
GHDRARDDRHAGDYPSDDDGVAGVCHRRADDLPADDHLRHRDSDAACHDVLGTDIGLARRP